MDSGPPAPAGVRPALSYQPAVGEQMAQRIGLGRPVAQTHHVPLAGKGGGPPDSAFSRPCSARQPATLPTPSRDNGSWPAPSSRARSVSWSSGGCCPDLVLPSRSGRVGEAISATYFRAQTDMTYGQGHTS